MRSVSSVLHPGSRTGGNIPGGTGVGMGMRLAFFSFMLVPLFIAAAACGEDDPGPDDHAPTATPTGSAVPIVTVTPDVRTPSPDPGLFVVDPATQRGTQATPGTRCWGGGCVDFSGPVTGDAPFAFNTGTELGWQVEGGAAAEVSHAWVASDDAHSEHVGDHTLAWRVPELHFEESGDIVVPAGAGEYLLVVFIRYTSGDDVLWGLYVTAE